MKFGLYIAGYRVVRVDSINGRTDWQERLFAPVRFTHPRGALDLRAAEKARIPISKPRLPGSGLGSGFTGTPIPNAHSSKPSLLNSNFEYR